MRELKKSNFILCDGKFYEGVHNPARRWNGWAMPWFTEAVMLQIAKDAGLTVTKSASGYYTGVFEDIEDDEQLMQVGGLYSFDGWCWDAYTDTEIGHMLSEELRDYDELLSCATDAITRELNIDRSKVTVRVVASYS